MRYIIAKLEETIAKVASNSYTPEELTQNLLDILSHQRISLDQI